MDSAVTTRRHGGAAELEGLHRRLEDGVLDLSTRLPAGTEDYEARRLFEYTVALRRALEPDEPDLDSALLTLVNFLDVLKRMERKLAHTRIEDPVEAVGFLLRVLSTQADEDVAELLGVSTRTLSAWRAGTRPSRASAGQILLVAQVVMYLRTSMTPRGLILWFRAPHDALDNMSPLELLQKDLDQAERLLRPLARGGRGQLAT